MKKISTIFSLLLLLAATACNNDFKSTYGFAPFIQVTTPTLSKSENSGNVVVQYQYVGPKLTQDLTLNLEVTKTSGTGVGITLPPATATIKAGEFGGTSTVVVVNDFTFNGNTVITIAVLSTSNPAIVAATPKTLKDKAVVTVVEDDCPYVAADYIGSYNLRWNIEFDFIYAAGDYPDNPVSLTAGAGANTVVDPDFGFLADTGRAAVAVTFKLDPSTASASISGTPFNFTNGTSDANAFVAYNSAPNRRVFVNKQVGSLGTCAKTIVIDSYIRREDGSIGQHMINTYVKQ
ncbi:hypothetical protein BH09BAC3_BH09BAC3_31070 [soil metagenome]